MGKGITIKCTTCNQEKDYLVGVRMFYFSLENVLKAVHWRNRRKVIEFRKNKKIKKEEHEKRIFF